MNPRSAFCSRVSFAPDPDGRRRPRGAAPSRLTIPRDQANVTLTVDGKEVRLTNLPKIFWPELGLTKGDLLQYYADVAHVLLPHIASAGLATRDAMGRLAVQNVREVLAGRPPLTPVTS